MMQQKSRAFNMPILRRRAKVMMRKKYKKTIKLSDLDKVWNDWVEYRIVRPLIEYGKVQIDDKTSIEIVGRNTANNPNYYSLLSRGVVISKSGFMTEPKEMGKNRDGLTYKIIFTDSNYKKGQLIFEANGNLSKRVSKALRETQTYYRIEK